MAGIELNDLKDMLKTVYLNAYNKGGFKHAGEFMLYGSPGIGKTQIIYQTANEIAEILGMKFVNIDRISQEEINKLLEEKTGKYFLFKELVASQLQPEDLSLPGVSLKDSSEDYYAFKVPDWAKLFQKHPGILFIDELTNTKREDVITALFKIIDQRIIGGKPLNDKVMIISAGNNTRESAVAEELPLPLINRMAILKVKCPRGKDWAEYAMSQFPEIPRDIIIFLSYFVDEYANNGVDAEKKLGEDEENRSFTTPRSIFKLLETFENLKGVECLKEGNSQKLKKIIAILKETKYLDVADQMQFLDYVMRRSKITNTLDSDPEKIDTPTKMAAAVILGEQMRQYALNDESIKTHALIPLEKIPEYLKKLSDRKEFINLFIMGLGAFEKSTRLSDSFKISVFAYEIINGKNIADAINNAQQIASTNIISRWIEKEEEVATTEFFSKPKNELATQLAETFDEYIHIKISNILNLISDYINAGMKNDKTTQASILQNLTKLIHEDDFKEIMETLERKVKNKWGLSESTRNKIDKNTNLPNKR